MEQTSLTDILNKETIFTHLDLPTKKDVIHFLAKKLLEQNYINSTDRFVRAVYEREKEGVTGVGNHVAIPHGKSDCVKKDGVAIAVLEHEITWESLDDTGAKVVVLFAVGDDPEQSKEHLRMLSLFARKLGKDKFVNLLVHAQDVTDVVNAFKS